MGKKSKKRRYTVHGKQMDFSKKEIKAILEKHIPKLPKTFEEAKEPTDGKCFKVELKTINIYLFLEERKDEPQELIRKIILKAIIKAWKKPKKYDVFYLLIPKKKWVYRGKKYITVGKAMDFAEKVGGYTETWIEEALGWAQRITNGGGSEESWDSVCNKPDTIKWYRLFIWKDSKIHIVGGAAANAEHNIFPSADISEDCYNSDEKFFDVVPGVVIKRSTVHKGRRK